MEKKGNVKKAGLVYTIGNYCIRGIGFLTLPIFTRLLTTADFGVFSTYQSYESILFIFIGLALHTSFKNAFIKYHDDFNEYTSNCTLVCCISLVVFLAGGVIFGAITGKVSTAYIITLMLNSFGTAIIAYYNAYLGLYYQSGSYVKIAGINAVGNVVISLFLILTVCNSTRAFGRILGYAIPTILIGFALVFRFWKECRPTWNKKQIGYALRYSLPLIPHGISQVLLSSCDRIMISSIVGSSEAGLYSFSYTLYSILSVTYSSLDQVWSPWFYEHYEKGDKESIRDKATVYALIMGMLAIGVMLVAPEVIFIFGSKSYHDAIYMVVPVTLGGFFSFLYNFPAVIEYFNEKTKYIAAGTMAAALINIVLNYICIKAFGYQAAAYTTLVTYLLYFVFHCVIAYRISGKEMLYNAKAFARIIVLTVVLGAAAHLLIPYAVIRWILAIADGIAILVIGERVLHISKILKRRSGKEN